MSRLKPFLLGFVLLIAFLIGAALAGIDYGLQYALRQASQTLAQQNIQLQAQKLSLALPAALQFHQLHLNTPNTPPLYAESLSLSPLTQWLDPQQLPKQFTLDAPTLRLDIPDLEEKPPVIMNALGYANYFLSPAELRKIGQAIHGHLQVNLKGEGQQLQLETQFNAGLWGDWSLAVTLDAVPPPAQWENYNFANAKLVKLQFRYQDHGLVGLLFEQMARRAGQNAAELRNALLTQLQNDLQRNQSPAFVWESLNRFIRQPDQLTVTFNLPTPLSFAQLQRIPPEQLDQRLGFNMQ